METRLQHDGYEHLLQIAVTADTRGYQREHGILAPSLIVSMMCSWVKKSQVCVDVSL